MSAKELLTELSTLDCKPTEVEVKRLSSLLHGMVTRCYCKTAPRYNDYGGRGICVSPEWYDSVRGKYHNGKFIVWALNNGYKKGLQIDRIDNQRGYFPDNCRFVTAHSNARNRRDTIIVDVDGEMMCGKDACKRYGIAYSDFAQRVKLGWNPKRAAMIPTGFRRRDVCFHRTNRGYCYHPLCAKCRKTKCRFGTDEQMRGCPYFYEYKHEDRDFVLGAIG